MGAWVAEYRIYLRQPALGGISMIKLYAVCFLAVVVGIWLLMPVCPVHTEKTAPYLAWFMIAEGALIVFLADLQRRRYDNQGQSA